MSVKTKQKYYEATGRRKTATARVRLWSDGKGAFSINGREAGRYFSQPTLAKLAKQPLVETAAPLNSISVLVKGGGLHSQAEAISHGVARALLVFDPGLKIALKTKNYLRRDARMKERRKFGLKKARKAPQWSKR